MRDVRVLAGGLCFGESPRWRDGQLWFSDFVDKRVATLDPDGVVTTVVEVPGRPSGLGWLPDGRLLVVSMQDRSVMRLDPAGLVRHADLSDIATFDCNDMVVDGSGRAYVGNFGFDLHREIASRGVAAVIADHRAATLARVDPDGGVHAAADDMHFPNGSVITTDGRTLLVAETIAFRISAFDIAEDGTLSNRRVWADAGARGPDGICLDSAGNVWFGNALGSECVLIAEGGEVLETIPTELPAVACCLGGDGGRTLYMMSAPAGASHGGPGERGGRILATQVDVPAARV